MTPIGDKLTGGSEADNLEQQEPAVPDSADDTYSVRGDATGLGTGGSEADLLEQAAAVPDDGDSDYPRGDEDEP